MPEFDLDTLSVHVGQDLGHSSWVTLDQDRIDTFAETTLDRQWIHIDPRRAADGPFGQTIAHGYLTLSLASYVLLQLLRVSGATSVINYGLDRVRFPAPVHSGERVRGHGQLVSADEFPGAVQTTTRITIEAEGRPKPAMVADVLTRFLSDAPARNDRSRGDR
jgi:acyl dehydratase